MSDRLADIFTWQKKFNDRVRNERQLKNTNSEWIQREAIALIVELGEVMEEVRYKWWKNPTPIEPEKVHEELVDVLHFFVSMCIDAGMDAESLYQGYLSKNQENFRRQDGLSKKNGYAPEV